MIGLDESLAFDLVDHGLLVDRLKLMGFDNNSLSWMKSYLSDRHQMVEIQGFKSEILPHPPCSIIQGSIASTILYNIHSMDIPYALHPHDTHTIMDEAECPNGSTVGFVDDKSLRVSGPDLQTVQIQTQQSVDLLESHITSNKSKINKEKSKIIIVSKSADQKEGISIQAAGKTIHSQKSFVLLGCVLSQDMKFIENTNILISQLTNRIIAIRQIAKYASRRKLQIICQSVILGKIYYAIQFLGSLPDYLATKIQKVIIQAAKLVLGKTAFRLSTSSILNKLGWMSYRQYEHYFTLRLTHESLSRAEPESLVSILGHPGPRVTRSQVNGARILPPWNKTVSRQSYRYRAKQYYNELPAEIKEIKSKQKRNNKLKQYTLSTVSPYIGASRHSSSTLIGQQMAADSLIGRASGS